MRSAAKVPQGGPTCAIVRALLTLIQGVASAMDAHSVLRPPRASRSMIFGSSFAGTRLPGRGRLAASLRPDARQAVRVSAILDVAKTAFAQQNGAKVDSKIMVDAGKLPEEIRHKMTYDLGTKSTSPEIAYRATALSVRQRLIDAFNKTQDFWRWDRFRTRMYFGCW